MFIFFALAALGFKASAQQYVLSGRITDQKNNPISFVSVYIKNSTYGTTSNENGVYQFKLTAGTYDIIYRVVGYKERTEKVTITDHDEQRDVQMEDEIFNRKEVIAKARADTAATEIMRKVIAKREFYLNEVKSYSCVVYVKGTQRLISAPKSLLREGVSRKLDLDTNGRGIINQSESLSNFSFAQPNKVKEVTIASRLAGIEPTFNYTKASDLQTDFYKNIFTISGLSSHGFVSPVADNAFAYYRYKLVGTTVENGRTIDEIELIPRREHDPVFRGSIYILEGDWRIYSVDLYLTRINNNLNLVDTMSISQQYVPVKDNIWRPVSVRYSYKGSVFNFKFEGYYIGIYNNYKFDIAVPANYFNGEALKIDTAANVKPESYWAASRPVPLTPQEALYYHKRDSTVVLKQTKPYLDSLQHVKNNLVIIPYTVFGYKATSRDNKDSLYVYPFIQTLFYNTVEGYGINLKVRYTKILDDYRSISYSPAIRYGFADKLFNANMHIRYNYDPFNEGSFFTDFGTDVLDLNNVGTRSIYFNTLSTLLSERNFVKYYHSQFGDVGYQREIKNGVLWTASLSYANRTQMFNNSYNHIFTSVDKQYTSNNPLAPPTAPPDDRSALFPQHQAFTFVTSFKITFDQQYITRPTGKVYLPSPYPIVTVNYRKGISNLLGSDVNYDFTSIDISQDRMRFGLWGYSSFKLTAGTFLNSKKLYFIDYNHFLGNQGTTFDPTYVGSFHFLPFYTYSANSTFLEAHYQHNFSGRVLNNTFLRKFKLEEIIGANYLTERNNPNYSEFYVGLQRLIFRVDYGVSFAGNKKYVQGIRIFYGIR
ncbi:MAG: hypothetical protein JWR67_3684 [Mucilaginibacter sp.]|nr:hypothetical protein [Mucilaginibacter sp.]